MDWSLAIARKQRELSAVLAVLLALVAAVAGRSAILRILRPAESAVRRLLVLFVRHALKPVGKSPPSARTDFTNLPKTGSRKPAFRLIDPRKRFAETQTQSPHGPRIWVIGMPTGFRPTPIKREAGLEAINLRVQALQDVLNHLPRHARRMGRLMARRTQAPPGPGHVGPLRPGLPPGSYKRRIHEIDEILADCQALATIGVWRPPRHCDEGWHVEYD